MLDSNIIIVMVMTCGHAMRETIRVHHIKLSTNEIEVLKAVPKSAQTHVNWSFQKLDQYIIIGVIKHVPVP